MITTNKISLFISASLLSATLSAQNAKIIFDTDMESDVDDVGALAMLHGLADNREAEILAVMVCSLNPWSVPTVDAVNTYFKKPDIPIGAVKTYGVYRKSKYAKIISEEFSQDIGIGENAPDATKLYREILHDQPDGSVTIVTVGYLTNLSYLLKSIPDDISPFNGEDLVKKKVKHIVVMGDRYPVAQYLGKWGNFRPDPEAVKYVAENWPTSIIFTGGGDFAHLFQTGGKTFDFKGGSNPVSRAYEIFLNGKKETHHSADFISVYIAVRGWEEFFELTTQGYNHIFEDGNSVWRIRPDDSRHQYVSTLKENVDSDYVTEVFDDLMVRSIKGK